MGPSRQRGQNLQRRRGVEHKVRAGGRLSVEPQTHLGSRRALKHEAGAVALNPVPGVLIRRGHGDTQTQRRQRHREEARERQTEIGAVLKQTKDGWQPPEGKGAERDGVPLKAPEGTSPAGTSSIPGSQPPEQRKNKLLLFTPPSLRSFVRKPVHL